MKKAETQPQKNTSIRVYTIITLAILLITTAIFLSLLANLGKNSITQNPTQVLKPEGEQQAILHPKPNRKLISNKLSFNSKLENEYKTYLVSLVFFLFFIIACIFIWFYWSKPVSFLNKSLQKIANGDFNSPVHTNGSKGTQELAKTLEGLRTKLAQKDKQQKGFLQHISHELKTPLASIKEGTSLLNDDIVGTLNTDQKEIIIILQDNIRELQNSIENLLDYNAALSAHRIKYRATTNLARLVQKSVSKHKMQIKRKNLIIRFNRNNVRAFVDREQILTAFNNLLSNAIKFSDENDTIDIELHKRESKAIFIIRDYGPGITEEDKKNIFDAFYIGEQKAIHSLRGTGLGLSIAKQYIEMNGGRIRLLESDLGATFEIRLRA